MRTLRRAHPPRTPGSAGKTSFVVLFSVHRFQAQSIFEFNTYDQRITGWNDSHLGITAALGPANGFAKGSEQGALLWILEHRRKDRGFDTGSQNPPRGLEFFLYRVRGEDDFWGGIRAKKIESALQRILGKVKEQNFNGLEITGIVANRFLGMPYAVVTAHSRHLQQNCTLDGDEARHLSRRSTAKT